MKKIDFTKETERLIRESVNQMADRRERHEVLVRTAEYLTYLNHVQSMPLVARLRYFRVAFHVYDYLRRNAQLGRRVGCFDRNVRERLEGLLSTMMMENAIAED